MSIQLAAKGHHMRKIVRNGEGEAGRACVLAVTKGQADQKGPIYTLSKMDRKPEGRQKVNRFIGKWIGLHIRGK